MSINPSRNEQTLKAIIQAAKVRGQKVRRSMLASAAANAPDNKDWAIGGG